MPNKPADDSGVLTAAGSESVEQLGESGVDNLKFLMDYTKFHIGLYVTLFSALVLAVEKKVFLPGSDIALQIAALFFVLAGIAGGVIGSSIPDAASFAQFQTVRLGPRWFKRLSLRYPTWAAIEHASFWMGILVLATFLVVRPLLAN